MATILVVEDESPILNALRDKLLLSGYEVLVAKNGADGLTLALSKKPDLILLDIMMPRVSGMAMLEELRKDEWGKDALVVILTNLEHTEKVADALNLGVHHYVVKSNTKIEEVVTLVEQELSK